MYGMTSILVTQMLALNKSRAEDIPMTGMKNIFSFKGLSDAEEFYFTHLIILSLITMYIFRRQRMLHLRATDTMPTNTIEKL